MAQDAKLSAVLSDFARTLTTDFPLQHILDRLVGNIVEILPITCASVALMSADAPPQYLAASNEAALAFGELQASCGEGPCLLARASCVSVSAPNLETDSRFPHFGPAAVAAGLGATFTFPLRRGAGRLLGVMDLYRDAPGGLDEHDMNSAQTLADVTAAYLLCNDAHAAAGGAGERVEHAALHDPVTGLPNRSMLQQRLDGAANRAKWSRHCSAVLVVDIDHFKQINDAHGHRVGDDVLVAVSRRLSRLVRPGDTLARFSGDAFAILREDLASGPEADGLAVRVEKSFDPPFVLPTTQVSLTASIGLAVAGPGEDANPQLDEADVAMCQVKRRGGASHQALDLREAHEAKDRRDLETNLRTDFARGALAVAYQPIVRSVDGEVTGLEVLLRWRHAERGVVPALRIVEIAEQSALINEIGAWVLERGCIDRAGWLRGHQGSELDLAVNVSARQLHSDEFTAMVTNTLERTGTDPKALVLELTENVLVEDIEGVSDVLWTLKELGVRLALDDFGTGYSSLNYLRRLPVDVVKIDQGFVAQIGLDPGAGTIVSAIADLAHSLGLGVVAEGVETPAQRDQIVAMGCESAQGYFFAKPMMSRAFAAMFAGTGAVNLPAHQISRATVAPARPRKIGVR